MTVDQAYKLIGVSGNSSRSQVEQAYKSKLEKLQRQLVAGQPLAVREQALREVAELVSAWELLKNRPWQSHSPPPANSPSRPRPQPAPSFAHQQSRAHRWSGSTSAPPLPNRAVAVSFLIAAIMMLAVIFLCVGASATSKPQKSAQLRVLSVPWCYVEIDGRKLGSSGQPEPFEIREGSHKLKLLKNNKVLAKKIELTGGRQTVVKAQFDKGTIDVSK